MPVSLPRCMVLLASADIARAFAPPRRGARQFRPSLLESSAAPAILEYREWFGGDVSLLRDDDLALGSFAAVAAGANGALFSLARAADGAIEARKASEDRRRRAVVRPREHLLEDLPLAHGAAAVGARLPAADELFARVPAPRRGGVAASAAD